MSIAFLKALAIVIATVAASAAPADTYFENGHTISGVQQCDRHLRWR
ncbi:MAG: hypothetical protein ACJAUW_001724 [Yoonia sp.]|jgi:hypothetical protein